MHQYQQKFMPYQEEKLNLHELYKAQTPLHPNRDPKWRFHCKVNQKLNVIPQDFQGWANTMNQWGINIRNGCLSVAQMLAIGLDIQPLFFVNKIENGAFHLAPTAVNLQNLRQGDVLAAFHRDFDLLTIHSKARFPGLFSWLNTGEKFMVNVPQGNLLLQAGKQFQWVAGGYITAGFHQVVYTKEVEQAKQKAEKNGKSYGVFLLDKVIMKPHSKFATEQTNKKYPQTTAAQYLSQQLYVLVG